MLKRLVSTQVMYLKVISPGLSWPTRWPASSSPAACSTRQTMRQSSPFHDDDPRFNHHRHHQAVNAPQFTYSYQPHRPVMLTRFPVFIWDSWVKNASLNSGKKHGTYFGLLNRVLLIWYFYIRWMPKAGDDIPNMGWILNATAEASKEIMQVWSQWNPIHPFRPHFTWQNSSDFSLGRESTSWRTSCPLRCRASATSFPWTSSRTMLVIWRRFHSPFL